MRIPELGPHQPIARKARLVPLSEAELAEREVLRKAYLKAVTGQMSNILSTVTVSITTAATLPPPSCVPLRPPAWLCKETAKAVCAENAI